MHTGFANSVQPSLLPSRREVVARIFRKRTVFIACFLLVLVGFALTGKFESSYQAEMKILVRKERVDSVMTAVPNSTPDLQQLSVSEEELNSEVELLQSGDLLHDVVLQAGLSPDPNNKIQVARAQKALTKQLDIAAVPKTDLIMIKYEGSDPAKTQKVLATLGALYLKRRPQLHGTSFEISFFDEQVRQHRNALEQAEGALLAFTRQTGVVSASLERDLTIQQMKSVSQQKMEAAAAAADAAGRSEKLQSELSVEAPRLTTASRQADNPQLLQNIKSTLLTLQLHRAELLAKYDPNYRLVKDTEVAIDIAQNMLDQQAKAPVQDTTTDLNPVAISLQGDLDRSRAELNGLQAKQVNLARSATELEKLAAGLEAHNIEQDRLLREVKTEQDEYQLYVNKRDESRMAASLDRQGILNVVMAEAPVVPALPMHSLMLMMLTALFTATVLSIGAALVADISDPTVRSAHELEELMAIPLLEEFGRKIQMERGVA